MVVGSGDEAQTAAFLGIGPADIARHKWEKSEILPREEHSYCFPLHIPTAGQCKQHPWWCASYAGPSHISVLPVKDEGPDFVLCYSPNPALKILQVSDQLRARKVLTNQH